MKARIFLKFSALCLMVFACAKPSENTSRIMDMSIQKKPDFVHHLVDGTKSTICTVTFINEYQAITAAHCLFDKAGNFKPNLKVMMKFADQPDPTLSQEAPIIAACYHPEFPGFLGQMNDADASKAHINPTSLSPFDFAVINIGGALCQDCDNPESIQNTGTSLRQAAIPLLANYKSDEKHDDKFDVIFRRPGNTFPPLMVEYLDLEKASLPADQQNFLTRLEGNFGAYVSHAIISGVGPRDDELNGPYRVQSVDKSNFKYQGGLGTTVSRNTSSDRPMNHKGDSGSALHFVINDNGGQFFGELKIPRPTAIIQGYPPNPMQRVVTGVNSGLSKKYGTYSLPQSLQNQIVLQSFIKPNISSTPTDPTKERPASILKTKRIKASNGTDIEVPLLDAATFKIKSVPNVYTCEIPKTIRHIQTFQTKIGQIFGGAERSVNSGGAFLTTNQTEHNYMATYLSRIANLANDNIYSQYVKTVEISAEEELPIDFLPLVVSQTSIIKGLANLPDFKRSLKKFQLRYTGQLLDWTSNLDGGIDLFPTPEGTYISEVQKSIGRSIFFVNDINNKCVGSVVNVGKLLNIESNKIYGMLPLHCLGSSFANKDAALAALTERCRSGLKFAIPDDNGDSTLQCRGVEETKLLARFPENVYVNDAYANTNKDIILFPLDDAKYQGRALYPQTQSEAPQLQHYNFYSAKKESNREVFVSAADETIFNVAFLLPKLSASEESVMPHRYSTEDSASGSIIVAHNGTYDSAEIICMHIGSLKEEDRRYIESQGKTPAANRCLHMSILNSVFEVPGTPEERSGDFASVKEFETTSGSSMQENIEAVPVTQAPAPTQTNVPNPPMAVVLPANVDAAPVAPVAAPQGSTPAPPATSPLPGPSGGGQLTCNQCTLDSDCFCCDNQAGLSCNLRADYPTASKSLSSISLTGQMPHISTSSPMVYRIKERVRTDSAYPLWFKVVYNGQESWVWSGQ